MYTQNPMHIVIADSDPGRAHALADALGAAHEGVRAMALHPDLIIPRCREALPSLAIVDTSLLGLADAIRMEFHQIPLVLMSTRVDEAQIESAVRLRATAVFRNPCEPAALLRVLAQPVPSHDFRGHCRGVPSSMLLALHCSSGSDGVLHFVAPHGMRGAIHLESGQPIHATCGDLIGPDAVRVLLSWEEAFATWLPGRTGCARTIIGRWEGVLESPSLTPPGTSDEMIPLAYPDVMEKLSRLAHTPDILGAFLLRNAEVVTGRCSPAIDEGIAGRALCRLAHVYYDVESQLQENDDSEVQATIGSLRLVVDRIGPDAMGFQVGVIVKQASPVCKSLRRLLRQIDRSFRKSMESNSMSDSSVRAAS
jgi:CheY-like chemotaxis protein